MKILAPDGAVAETKLMVAGKPCPHCGQKRVVARFGGGAMCMNPQCGKETE